MGRSNKIKIRQNIRRNIRRSIRKKVRSSMRRNTYTCESVSVCVLSESAGPLTQVEGKGSVKCG